MNSNLKTNLVLTFLLLGSVLITGAVFGTGGNHHTYLLKGLKMANPDLWPRDWWLNETPQYHVLFSYLIYILELIGITAPTVFLGNILSISLTYWFFWKIIVHDTKDWALPIFVLFMLIVSGFRESFSIALTFLHLGGFQPASIPTVGFIASIYYFLRKDYSKTGIILGLSGLFHANFAIVSILTFGLAHLLLGKERFINRITQQFLPQLILFLPLLPSILSTIEVDQSPTIVAEAIQIIKLRSSHHYDFNAIKGGLPKYIIVFSIGIFSAAALKRINEQSKNLFAINLSLFLILLFTIFEVLTINSNIVNRLFLWRVAPIYEALSYMSLFTALFVFATKILDTHDKEALELHKKKIWIFATTIGVILFGYITTQKIHHNKYWVSADPLPEIYSVIKNTTDKDSLFIIPTNLRTFRQFSQRSVVVTDPEIPLTPSATLEWYDRIITVTGSGDISKWDTKALETQYHSSSPEDIKNMSFQYDADYMVFRKKMLNDYEKIAEAFLIAYEDESFVMIELPSHTRE